MERTYNNRSLDVLLGYLVAIVLAVLTASPGVRKWMQGDPLEEWIVEVAIGILIVGTIFAIEFVSMLEHEPSSATRFGSSDWTALIAFGSWPVCSGIFYLFGFQYHGMSGFGLLLFALLGLLGVSGMLYKKFRQVE